MPTAPDGVRFGASSSPGRARAQGEDAACCGPTWFAVADGVGGRDAGGVASRVAVERLRAHPPPRSVDGLAEVVADVNAVIRAAARRDGAPGMGTTLVAATWVDGGMAILHIGDSRCYRLADGVLSQLTRDHSHVQELVDLGRLDAEAARHHRLRNVITRALGVDAVPMADTSFVAAPVGRLLLCSDGVSGELTPRTIGRVLAGIADPQAAADRLVELARRGTGHDDMTALVVDHGVGAP